MLTRVPNDHEYTLSMSKVVNSCGGFVLQTIKASETVLKRHCRKDDDDDDDEDCGNGEDIDVPVHYPNVSLHHLVIRLLVQLLHRTYHIITQQQQQGDEQVPSDLLCKCDSLMQDIIGIQGTVRVQQRLELLSCLQTYFLYIYQCHAYSTSSSNAYILENATATPLDATLTVMWRVTWYENDNQHPAAIQCSSADLDDVNKQHTCAMTMYNAATTMEQTLDRLLNESSYCSDDDSDIPLLYFQRALQLLLQCTHTYMDIQCMQLLPTVLVPMPTYFTLAVSQWTQQQRQQLQSETKSIGRVHQDNNTFTAQEKSSSWAYVLLSILHKWLYIRSMHDISDGNISGRCGKLLQWETIQKFLLICIVTIDDRLFNELASDIDCEPTANNFVSTPEDTPKTIRSTAWSCISLMSTTIGLEETWVNGGSIESTHDDSDDAATVPAKSSITKTYSACSRFGAWRNFCSLVRFATGEWKIHLTMIIEQFTIAELESETETPLNNESKQQGIMIVSSISDFFLATISYLVQYADDDDNHDSQHCRILPPPDAIRHLQQSLTEVHMIATQYLELANSTDRDTVTIDCVDECVNRVFTSLTSELEC